MIHSLAGGVLADGEIYTFAKVRTGETAMWYLVPELVFVKEGDRVLVPEGHFTREGVVETVPGRRRPSPWAAPKRSSGSRKTVDNPPPSVLSWGGIGE